MGKGVIISVGLLALSLTGLALVRVPLTPVLEELAPIAFAETVVAPIGSPVRLRIPRIKVNAIIKPVALTPAGAMDVPKKPMDAGWYALGPRPGETGSAVIAGHVNWWGGKMGVFKQLRTVVPGDRLSVMDAAGKEMFFIVREMRTYDAAADATDIFFSTDGKAHLNLITCEGAWNARTKQYGERLVVFADGE